MYWKKGTQNATIVGDNVEFGMNSVLLGSIILGNNIFVGAGSVVTHSYEMNNISIAGVPAKIIKHSN